MALDRSKIPTVMNVRDDQSATAGPAYYPELERVMDNVMSTLYTLQDTLAHIDCRAESARQSLLSESNMTTTGPGHAGGTTEVPSTKRTGIPRLEEIFEFVQNVNSYAAEVRERVDKTLCIVS